MQKIIRTETTNGGVAFEIRAYRTGINIEDTITNKTIELMPDEIMNFIEGLILAYAHVTAEKEQS